MKNTRLLLTLALTIPCLISCGQETKTYVTFHQEKAEDVKIEFTKDTLQSEIEIQEPDIVGKDGHTSAWEEYTIEGKTSSFTVNALYSPITYYASFKAQGVLVENVPYTINDITSEHSKLPADREPEVPAHDWCEAYWEDYSLELNNIVVNAKYDIYKEFSVTFMAEGLQVGPVINITRNDLDAEGKIEESVIPQEVKDYTVEGKDVIWNFVVTEPVNTTITAQVLLHPYYIKFVDFDGNQVGDLVPYTVENTTWESINKPEAPEVAGYDTSWNEATLTYSDNEIVVATPKKVGKMYVVSFEGYEGTQSVQYGEPYELEHKTLAIHKWFDEEDTLVPDKGVWNKIGNAALHLGNVDKENFDSTTVPEWVDVDRSINVEDVQIAEGEGINGGNALRFKVKACDFGLKIKQEYLDDVFSDPSVKTLTLVAKSSIHNNNWRHRTSAYNTCYEINDKKFGIETYYKKFSFTREMYNNHNDSTDFIIWGGTPDGGSAIGSYIYVDSLIFNEDNSITDGIEKLSFENGTVYSSGGKFFWYSLYYNAGSMTYDSFFVSPGSTSLTNAAHSDSMATDGISSLTFTKGTGYIALYMGAAFTKAVEASASKKFAFDIYSTVHVNSNAAVKNLTDGKNNPFTNQGGKLEPNKWTTFILDSTMYTASSDSGRFLIIQGSSGGTYYLDNFRILSE